MIVILILSLILLSVGLVLIYQAKKIKIQRTNQINKAQQEIEQKQKELISLNKQIETYNLYLDNNKKNLNTLYEACNEVKEELYQKKKI